MNETLDALQRAMRARDPAEARRLFTGMETAGTLTRADLRAGTGRPGPRGEDAGWLLAVLDGEAGDQDDATAVRREALRSALVRDDDDGAAELLRDLVGGHKITIDQLTDTVAAAVDEIRAGVRLGRRRVRATRPAPATVAGRAAASEAPRYRDAAADCLEPGKPVSHDAAAITYALLYAGAAVAEASERRAEDADAMSAMLAERLGAIEDSIDTAIGLIDPPFILPPPRPLRALLAGLFRRAPDGRA
jgi:hypothetical protein